MTALRERPSHQIEIAGEHVPVKVRESSRAKTTRILVGLRRPLEIIVPVGTADEEIDRQLATRRGWITEKLEAVEAERARPAQLGLDQPATFWLGGEALRVVESRGPTPAARIAGPRVFVTGPNRAARAEAVRRLYRREARQRLRSLVAAEAARLGLNYRSVTVRDQQTRWGSCSAAGNLSFNWRLVIAPPDVMAYVVIHELCHLAVPNHSKAFWRRLEAARPGWQHEAAWLREHGAELRAY